MNDDLINRKIAYAILSEYYHHKTDEQHKALWDALSRVPSAQPKQRKARWKGDGLTDYRCSLCGGLNTSRKKTNYCGNCGADMRKETEDEDNSQI